MFKSVRRVRVSDEVANQIKSLITQGKLKPGDRLPPERELIKEFGVSRPSLREALNSLVAMGFLEATQGNRTVVKSLVSGKIFEPLEDLVKGDINTVFELIEVRKAIETWSAYFAAKRATSEDISRLEELITTMSKTLKGEGHSSQEKQDADFHLAITLATHNKIQVHIMYTLHDVLKEWIGKHYDKLSETIYLTSMWPLSKRLRRKIPNWRESRIFEHLEYVESRVREDVESEKRLDNGRGIKGRKSRRCRN